MTRQPPSRPAHGTRPGPSGVGPPRIFRSRPLATPREARLPSLPSHLPRTDGLRRPPLRRPRRRRPLAILDADVPEPRRRARRRLHGRARRAPERSGPAASTTPRSMRLVRDGRRDDARVRVGGGDVPEAVTGPADPSPAPAADAAPSRPETLDFGGLVTEAAGSGPRERTGSGSAFGGFAGDAERGRRRRRSDGRRGSPHRGSPGDRAADDSGAGASDRDDADSVVGPAETNAHTQPDGDPTATAASDEPSADAFARDEPEAAVAGPDSDGRDRPGQWRAGRRLGRRGGPPSRRRRPRRRRSAGPLRTRRARRRRARQSAASASAVGRPVSEASAGEDVFHEQTAAEPVAPVVLPVDASVDARGGDGRDGRRRRRPRRPRLTTRPTSPTPSTTRSRPRPTPPRADAPDLDGPEGTLEVTPLGPDDFEPDELRGRPAHDDDLAAPRREDADAAQAGEGLLPHRLGRPRGEPDRRRPGTSRAAATGSASTTATCRPRSRSA